MKHARTPFRPAAGGGYGDMTGRLERDEAAI
jgi:hypothetical protein